MISCDVVIPTVGRPSLAALLAGLERQTAALPGRVLVVDDRIDQRRPLVARPTGITVLAGEGRGPAAARNVGWRAAAAEWVAFLDDDVEVPADWVEELLADLAAAGPRTGGVQGRLHVPLPTDRPPTDWERNVGGLGSAHWATADMAYRWDALAAAGGFDERFPRAYREDADLALRVADLGWGLARGRRRSVHPVRPAPWHVSVGKQAGNADDAFMAARHGSGWRQRAGAATGALARHVQTVAAAALAVGAAAAGRRRLAGAGAAVWAMLTAGFAWSRVAPGPRTPGEVAAMLATSAAIPPAAVGHRLAGAVRAARRLHPRRARAQALRGPRLDAVLFDRDGTLVVDVPYNGDPDRVTPVAGAAEALDRLRAAGVRVGVISNQSGVARGLISRADAERVNARVEALLGPFDAMLLCEHGPGDGCECRKPRPGMVHKAAAELGTSPGRCAVVGDIGADVAAGLAAGARAVLVPTPVTRRAEVAAAPVVAATVAEAVDLLLGSRR